MSMEQGRQVEDVRKQELLQSHPLLRYFLDQSFNPNVYHWDQAAATTLITMYREIEAVRGESWDSNLIEGLTEEWEKFGTTSPNLTRPHTKGLIATYLMVGYEVGEVEDLQLFTQDFRERNKELGLIAPKFLKHRTVEFAQDFLYGVAYHGAILRNELKDEIHEHYHPRASSTSNWGVWEKYIANELDMEKI